MKRPTVKQQAEAYAERTMRPVTWDGSHYNNVAAAFEAGYRAAQRAARKTKNTRSKK